MQTYDAAIIGGGIVGLAAAMDLVTRFQLSLLLVEAEKKLASHQTGHNSGVIHSGIYYAPGSLKARNCTIGREKLYQFCAEHGIPHRRCGKLIIACSPTELPALARLHDRGIANGLHTLRRLNQEEIAQYEPHAQGLAALWVPETGVVDYPSVARQYARLATEHGASILTQSHVTKINCGRRGFRLTTTQGEFSCRYLLNCAGLQSDRIARMAGVHPGVQIIPFRGDYHDLSPSAGQRIRNLIYPVPDPRYPFLGVHFTRGIDGKVEAGPSAVLSLSRSGYHKTSFSMGDALQMILYPGFWGLLRHHAKPAIAELHRSFSKRKFLQDLRRMVPHMEWEDLQPGGSGIRAQAVDRRGHLLDDFCIVQHDRMIHVLNVPSPAATASLQIGRQIADLLAKRALLRNINRE